MPAPNNMRLVKLPIDGLAPGNANALVAWTPGVSFAAPLLVVLFFHGLEPNPQNFAHTRHHLPEQMAETAKNAILIAPTMRVSGNVEAGYLGSFPKIVTLVEEGVLAAGKALGKIADHAGAKAAVAQSKLHLAAYSNGHIAWTRAIETLRDSAQAATTLPRIGHSLFDCLYWSTPLMDGAEHVAPVNARFSDIGRAIPQSAFVTTHFTSINPTLTRAKSLKVMVEHEPAFRLHDDVPTGLDAGDVVIAHLSTSDHDETVNIDHGLARVIAAIRGFDLPASPSV